MFFPPKKVGQTGSLPGFIERSDGKNQGKLPGSAATRDEGSSGMNREETITDWR
jgi:hypothetical protein